MVFGYTGTGIVDCGACERHCGALFGYVGRDRGLQIANKYPDNVLNIYIIIIIIIIGNEVETGIVCKDGIVWQYCVFAMLGIQQEYVVVSRTL